jgi:hypothetical protein
MYVCDNWYVLYVTVCRREIQARRQTTVTYTRVLVHPTNQTVDELSYKTIISGIARYMTP